MPRPATQVRADPARLVAYDVLRAVRVDDAYANLVLPRLLAREGLTGRDAAFATELASGTLRRRGTYEPVIRACLDRPRLEAKVLDALLVGCHQLLGMRVPAHAAISTTVDLVRARVGRGPAGLVNAVLRRVARDDLDTWLARVAPDPGADPVGHAAVVHSHPGWVVEALRAALAGGGAAHELDRLLAADNEAPEVCLVARPGLVGPGELEGARGVLSPYAVRLPRGAPADLPAVVEGRAGVQDEGSQVVALVAARAPLSGPDETWLDMCAGPGGKAALLAAVAPERGARLLAGELQPHRARLVRRGSRAVGEGLLGVVAADGRRPAWREGSFDRVLLDAPCTGLGALRRRPEARWRRAPEDVAGLVDLQRELLDRAVWSARPGGLVTYATCSPLLAETADVVRAVLAGREDVTLLDANAVLGLPSAEGPLPGTLQLWPHRHGTDAMFVAVLRRAG